MIQTENLGGDKGIRLFVSSTFRDLQSERNALARDCFPMARRRFAMAGIGFTEIDLRWGLPTGESEEQIVELCLQEVERCQGYFACILGSRYGYIPENETLFSRYSHLTLARKTSITELEIRHGVLARDSAKFPFVHFYFKQDGVPADDARLDLLKQEIRSKGFSVREYRTPEQLARFMLDDLVELAERLTRSDVDSADTKSRRFLEHQCRGVAPRSQGLHSLDAFLADKDARICLVGPAGSGKTTLLAQWIQKCRSEPVAPAPSGWRGFLPSFSGKPNKAAPLWLHYCATAHADSGLGSLVGNLLAQLGAGETGASSAASPLKDHLRALHQSLALAVGKHRQVVLVIDGIDELSLDEVLPFHWLPPGLDSLKIILAGRTGGLETQLPQGEWQRLHLDPFAQNERGEALSGYLAGFGKALTPALLDQAARTEALRRPLFLRLLADELRLAETPEHLDQMASALLQTSSPSDLFGFLLARLEQEHGAALMAPLCAYLACSRGGLEESELRAMMRQDVSLPDMHWAGIVQNFSRSVIEQDGLFGLYQEDLRQVVMARYLSLPGLEAQYRGRLLAWFKCECTATPMPSPRVIHELPWQMVRCEAWDDLEHLLTTPAFFASAWADDPTQIIGYWRVMESFCPARAPAAYALWTRSTVATLENMAALGLLLANLGHLDAAVEVSLVLNQRLEHGQSGPLLLSNLLNMAGFFMEGKQTSAAGDTLAQAQQLLLAGGHPQLAVAFHTLYGNWLFDCGQYDAALTSLQKAESLHQGNGDDYGMHFSQHNQALVLISKNQYDAARKMLSECAKYFEFIHDVEACCDSLHNMAVASEKAGAFKPAIQALIRLENLSRARKDGIRLAKALNTKARLVEILGDRDGAEAALVECEALCRQRGEVAGEVDALVARATLRINLGPRAYNSAASLLLTAVKIAEKHRLDAQTQRIKRLGKEIGARR